MKICVLWLGRASTDGFQGEVTKYRKRVCRRWQAEDRSLRPVAGGRSSDPRRALALESKLLEKHVPEGWYRVALDEHGTQRSSTAFARWLDSIERRGIDGIAFAIGSDLGLDRSLLDRFDECVALSSMTLPHALVRVLLWEQLFRATHILTSGAYHRSVVQ